MKDRFIISKGWEGFCDRLQCLSYCMIIALHYNRILAIDWNDRLWTHDRRGFYDYFVLTELEFVSLSQIPRDVPIHPGFWNIGLEISGGDWLYYIKDQVALDPAQYGHYEPVWVHPGIGWRQYDCGLLYQHLQFTPDAAQSIKNLIANVPPDLPVVHLRGTDRPVVAGALETLIEKAPVAVVVADDARLAKQWMAMSPRSIVASNPVQLKDFTAEHRLTAETLSKLGTSKHEMNIRLLADFVLLARAKEAYTNNEQSVFFQMARGLAKCGPVDPLFRDSHLTLVRKQSWPG